MMAQDDSVPVVVVSSDEESEGGDDGFFRGTLAGTAGKLMDQSAAAQIGSNFWILYPSGKRIDDRTSWESTRSRLIKTTRGPGDQYVCPQTCRIFYRPSQGAEIEAWENGGRAEFVKEYAPEVTAGEIKEFN